MFKSLFLDSENNYIPKYQICQCMKKLRIIMKQGLCFDNICDIVGKLHNLVV
jgi:hypothetical protein